jgi:hypothetical protein
MELNPSPSFALSPPPLTFIPYEKQEHLFTSLLKVLSLNLLAQHLIDGELPAYPYRNSLHEPILRDLRLKQLQSFLSTLSDQDQLPFDIINFQEIGPLDVDTVEKLRVWMST